MIEFFKRLFKPRSRILINAKNPIHCLYCNNRINNSYKEYNRFLDLACDNHKDYHIIYDFDFYCNNFFKTYYILHRMDIYYINNGIVNSYIMSLFKENTVYCSYNKPSLTNRIVIKLPDNWICDKTFEQIKNKFATIGLLY